MKLYSYKAVTPGTRHRVRLKVSSGVQSVPRGLLRRRMESGGRNHHGRISCYHRGGGYKVYSRVVSMLRPYELGVVIGTQSAPRRTAPLALVMVLPSVKSRRMLVASQWMLSTWSRSKRMSVGRYTRLILLGDGMEVNDYVGCIVPGLEGTRHCRLMLKDCPGGSRVYGVSDQSYPVRWLCSAGVSGLVIGSESSGLNSTVSVLIRLPSGEERYFDGTSFASLGQMGAKDHHLEVVGKAGINRGRGVRPTVRGVAINPVDHPHGGRTKGGRHDVTPWRRIAKGQPTRSKKKPLGVISKLSRTVKLELKRGNE